MTDLTQVKALAFDVFGTTVDWCAGIARESERALAPRGHALDWTAFANRWRRDYQIAMGAVREGRREYVRMDALHRELLLATLAEYSIEGLSDVEINSLSLAWRRLEAWPDVVDAMHRLKQRFVLAALSNANISLALNMAKYAGLPWDVILGADIVRTYKPMAQVYDSAPDLLDLAPGQVMMVACHVWDLRHSAKRGLRTAFVARSDEYGPGMAGTPPDPGEFDLAVGDFGELADTLGA
jgi:2-haloacid dehalogenase